MGDNTDVREMRELFLAMLGHDLRQPIFVIKAAASLGLTKEMDKEAYDNIFRRIVSATARMDEMVTQLVDFSRIKNGNSIPLNRELVDLRYSLLEVIDDCRLVHPEVHIDLVVEDGSMGQWDRDRLRQVFTNLIVNAINHGSPEHGVQVRIYSGEGGSTCVDVTNRGELPEALLPDAIWDPFKRGFRSSQRGLGLGLFITRYLVTAHGGHVSARSTDDTVTFTVCLPQSV